MKPQNNSGEGVTTVEQMILVKTICSRESY